MLALVAGGGAWAKEGFLVLPFTAVRGASGEDAARFTQAVQAQLGLEGLLWVPPAPAPVTRPVHADFVEAQRRYRARRFSQAKASLERAFAALEREPAAFDPQEVASGYVLLAAVELRAGRERHCRRALEQALRADPAYRPPRGAYPPIFERELERARRALRRVPRVALTVEGPEGAEVFLDGKRVGTLPGVRVRVLSGRHHLHLKGAQGEALSEWISVRGATELPVFFPPAPEQEAPPVLSGAVLTPAFASTLARSLEARHATLAVVGVLSPLAGGELEAHAAVFQVQGATFTAVKPVRFDAAFHAADGEARVLAQRLAEAADAHASPVPLPYALVPEPAPTVVAPPAARSALAGDRPTASRLQPAPHPRPDAAPRPLASIAATPQPADGAEASGSFLSRVPTWVWIVGGVGVAAGAGATYYAVSQHGRPVTGTVEATW